MTESSNTIQRETFFYYVCDEEILYWHFGKDRLPDNCNALVVDSNTLYAYFAKVNSTHTCADEIALSNKPNENGQILSSIPYDLLRECYFENMKPRSIHLMLNATISDKDYPMYNVEPASIRNKKRQMTYILTPKEKVSMIAFALWYIACKFVSRHEKTIFESLAFGNVQGVVSDTYRPIFQSRVYQHVVKETPQISILPKVPEDEKTLTYLENWYMYFLDFGDKVKTCREKFTGNVKTMASLLLFASYWGYDYPMDSMGLGSPILEKL